jgi:hypothetical protein
MFKLQDFRRELPPHKDIPRYDFNLSNLRRNAKKAEVVSTESFSLSFTSHLEVSLQFPFFPKLKKQDGQREQENEKNSMT